ncbi:MAG TPA: glycerol kinase GlpK, partial [Hyphomicrobiales bacterium]|nr:glycerol kinase GlpK [Hyphomicrobiales bacterium]
MADGRFILAIDQGTTSTRAIVFDRRGQVRAVAQRPLAQHFPGDGLVEHDLEEIWQATVATVREAVAKAGLAAGDLAAIGIANQRETTALWERASGRPVHRAIVWQDRRTAAVCARLREEGAEPPVRAKTGLVLDPYFSATKLAWLLDHVEGARGEAARGALAFGTIDSFLLWRLTGGRVHATDAANASRTLLYDIHRQRWDAELLRLFAVPPTLLPEVVDNAAVLGMTEPALFGAPVPVAGMAGDQQAALIGQGCLRPGMAKATYGTGAFILANTGQHPVGSPSGLLATTAWRLGGEATYALEGAIFVAGAAIKWLRDGLGVVRDAAETAALAATVPDDHRVFLVPAFVGLGAPYWDPGARGLIAGLGFDAGPAHLARAALEAVAYQTADLVGAMAAAGTGALATLRIDGGMAANDWLCQFLADVLGLPVERPRNVETTALGAAMLAGVATGVWPGLAAAAAACWSSELV